MSHANAIEQMEAVVLNGLIEFGTAAWLEACESLTPDAFTVGEFRELFVQIRDMHRRGEHVDAFTLAPHIDGDLLADLLRVHCSRHALPWYIEHVATDHARRRALDIGAALAHGDIDPDEANAALRELGEKRKRRHEPRLVRQGVEGWIEQMQERLENPTLGIGTPWSDLDRITGGFLPGNLALIAGRPGMGKTAVALNIATHQAEPVLMFSLEMTEPELVGRMISAQGVDHRLQRHPADMTDADWARVTNATAKVREMPIVIDDRGGLSIDILVAEIERAVRAHGIRTVIVDYVQLVRAPGESRVQQVGTVSRELKAAAKNHGVAMIALAQMNRDAEKRVDPKPRLSDLREAGDLEQDADQVIFVHRPEVLDEGKQPGEAFLYVRKNRHGETGEVRLRFQGQHQRFVQAAFEPSHNWTGGGSR